MLSVGWAVPDMHSVTFQHFFLFGLISLLTYSVYIVIYTNKEAPGSDLAIA